MTSPAITPLGGEPLFIAPAVPVVIGHQSPRDDLVEAGIALLDAGDNLITVLDRALTGRTVGLLLQAANNDWRRASSAFATAIDNALTQEEAV